jgi:hypothetical protein
MMSQASSKGMASTLRKIALQVFLADAIASCTTGVVALQKSLLLTSVFNSRRAIEQRFVLDFGEVTKVHGVNTDGCQRGHQ